MFFNASFGGKVLEILHLPTFSRPEKQSYPTSRPHAQNTLTTMSFSQRRYFLTSPILKGHGGSIHPSGAYQSSLHPHFFQSLIVWLISFMGLPKKDYKSERVYSLIRLFVYRKMDFNDISQQWVSENEDLKEMSIPIEQIDFPLERMSRCTATEFKLLSFMTQTQYHVDKLYKHPQQFPMNRHSSFMTFEPTRVRLGNQDNIQNYINANMISVAGKRVIATQGPLTITIYNFWRMIQQYQVPTIFMLCNLIEKGQIKCDKYFPQQDANNGTLIEKQYTIKLLEEQHHPLFQNIKIRKFQLTNTQQNATKEVNQYHITNWPDGRSPKQCQGMRFLIDKLISEIQKNSIPVVHCSAGVGRTGTLIAMAVLKILISNNQPISVFNQIRKLKQQRWGMIYTSSQYDYLYEYAEHEIVKMQNGILSAHSEYSEDQEENEENNQNKV